MYKLDADPEVHTYLGNKQVTSKEQAMGIIHFIRQQYIDHGIGRWAIMDKKRMNLWAGQGLNL